LLEVTAQVDDVRTAHASDEGNVTRTMREIVEAEGFELAE
jgi:hypothetical protein